MFFQGHSEAGGCLQTRLLPLFDLAVLSICSVFLHDRSGAHLRLQVTQSALAIQLQVLWTLLEFIVGFSYGRRHFVPSRGQRIPDRGSGVE